MTTMEEVIAGEADLIITLTLDHNRPVADVLANIRRAARNIQRTLEEGDPK